jgi:penicillin V acylase-like amidase (Ntn superfamily)
MKTLITICLLTLNSVIAYSCTTFVLKNDNSLVFGRNLDWVSDNGVIVVNKRNIQKTSLVFPPEKSTTWTSKYGSITFNQFGKELPFGGINEKGLVVEIMLVSGNYPDFDKRTAINELQWIQYQLDNAETIEDIIESDNKIRISKIDQNLHFLICDNSGNVAVIEFDKKGMHVYKGADLPIPVLENDLYSRSLEKNKAKEDCRFRTASNMLEQYYIKPNSPAVDYSFNILDKVALDGSWSIIYDIKNMEIHFKTSSDKTLKKIRINDFDFNCKEVSKLYDLARKDKEYINMYFTNYSSELNNNKLDAAIKSNGIQLPKDVLNQFYNYNKTCNCLIK